MRTFKPWIVSVGAEPPDSLDNAKNSEVLLSILQDHFKTNFWLDVICEKQEHPENLDAENIALEVFGGESAI